MLPSKKILVALAILIVGIGALILYSYTKKSNNYIASNTNTLAVATSSLINIDSSVAQVDSDKDELPDWEEALYGTNPNKADTDGDGTPDGKEVALGRNPLVKGPNDLIVVKKVAVASTTPEKLTATDVFARDFFTQYAKLNKSGVAVTTDNAGQIATDYLKNAPLPTINAKQYETTDLTLTDSNTATLRSYNDAITAVFAKYWPSDKTSEMTILQEAFSNNNPKALSGLTSIIAAYQNTLNNSLTLAIPKLAAGGHLNVLNALSNYIQTLKMIQNAFIDPVSGLVGLNSFQDNQSNLIVSTADLKIYLINNVK